MLFGFDAALPRSLGRTGWPAHPRGNRSTADEIEQTLQRILPVAALGAVTLRDDDQKAVARKPGASQPFKPHTHVLRQRRRGADIEAQLNRGCELVDILPARPRRAHEAFFDFVLVDADAGSDAKSWLGDPRSWMTFFETSSRSSVLFGHDPFGKPASTFPDHARARIAAGSAAYGVLVEAIPSGRPATVTNIPVSSIRLATRRASSSVTPLIISGRRVK